MTLSYGNKNLWYVKNNNTIPYLRNIYSETCISHFVNFKRFLHKGRLSRKQKYKPVVPIIKVLKI